MDGSVFSAASIYRSIRPPTAGPKRSYLPLPADKTFACVFFSLAQAKVSRQWFARQTDLCHASFIGGAQQAFAMHCGQHTTKKTWADGAWTTRWWTQPAPRTAKVQSLPCARHARRTAKVQSLSCTIRPAHDKGWFFVMRLAAGACGSTCLIFAMRCLCGVQ